MHAETEHKAAKPISPRGGWDSEALPGADPVGAAAGRVQTSVQSAMISKTSETPLAPGILLCQAYRENHRAGGLASATKRRRAGAGSATEVPAAIPAIVTIRTDQE